MITTEQLLAEIERQVEVARKATNEQSRREALTAVRSLCNVVLNDESAAPVQREEAMPIARPVSQYQPSMQEQPLVESGANGESLFDF